MSKQLIMQSAIDAKDSVFKGSMCFDFRGRTYEFLPPHPKLDTRHDDGSLVKYRFVCPVDDHNDYDYVDIGSTFVSSDGELIMLNSMEEVREAERQLDAHWRQYIIAQPISTRSDGERFVESMHGLDLLWHFDDDPTGVICGGAIGGSRVFTDDEAIELRKRVDELHKLDWSPHGNVFGYALLVHAQSDEERAEIADLEKMERSKKSDSDFMGFPKFDGQPIKLNGETVTEASALEHNRRIDENKQSSSFLEQIKVLEKLKESFVSDPKAKQEIQAAIDALSGETNTKHDVKVDAKYLPEHLRHLVLPTGRLKAIAFDVSHEFSLDELRKDMEACMKNPNTKCHFDIRGPGGGNTRVLFTPADDGDKERCIAYIKQHKLGTYTE